MAYSAIQQISERFTKDSQIVGSTGRPQNLTRYLGGHSRTGHPYVNGYWQFFISPPCVLFQDIADVSVEWFHATAEGFTPPSRNLNKADVPGQGGVGSSWVTGQTLQRTFSVTHREYRDIPILRLYQLWTSIILPHIGVSEISGHAWMGTSYKGHAMAVLTKPTGQTQDENITEYDIEEVFYFDGVWPENEPTDTLSQDISSNDIVQYTMNFSFDGWVLTKQDKKAVEMAVKIFNNYHYQRTYDIYTTDVNTFTTGCQTPASVKG